MALPNNFYKGNNILRDKVLDDYVQGKYFDKALGVTMPIPEGCNKYNKDFLIKIKELNMQYFGLLRAENVIEKLLKIHEKTSFYDLHTIYNLMRAQGGTIKYNKLLRSALKKYKIQKQEIYNSISRDLKSQEERAGRNKILLINLMNDFGLGCLCQYIQESTGRDIVEDILQFTLDNDKNIDFTPSSKDEETQKKEIDEYYDNLDNEYINNLLKYNSGENLFKTISDSLQQYHEKREQCALKSKQDKKERIQNERIERAHKLLDSDNAKINRTLNRISEMRECEFSDYEFDLLNVYRTTLKFNGTAYYVAYIGCKQNSKIHYMCIDKNANYGSTSNLSNALLFANEQEAIELKNRLLDKQSENSGKFNNVIFEVAKLQTLNTSKKSIDIEAQNKRALQLINNQLMFYTEEFAYRLINTHLLNILTFDSNRNQLKNRLDYYYSLCNNINVTLIALYRRLNNFNNGEYEIKYLGKSGKRHIKYTDINNRDINVSTELTDDIRNTFFIDHLNNAGVIDKQSLLSLKNVLSREYPDYNLIEYNDTLNFSSFIQNICKCDIDIHNDMGWILKRKPELFSNKVYIVTIGRYGYSLKFLGKTGKGEMAYKQTLTENVNFYTSYTEALLDLIKVLKNNNRSSNSNNKFYKIHEIDMNTLE